MTPSITYNGCVLPVSVDVPRRFTLTPPPGAPVFRRTFTPANCPLKAWSIVWVGALTKSSPVTTATALAAFRRLTDVTSPVTTTSSCLKISGSSAMFITPSPKATSFVL